MTRTPAEQLAALGIYPTERRAVIVEATRPLVDALIALNTHNRSLQPTQVKRIATDIMSGAWVLTNQGIGVCKDGYVTDGQHRLYAIRDAGYPPGLELMVVTGLSPQAQAVVDVHARRKQADVLSLLLNTTVANRVVAALNAMGTAKEGPNGFYYAGTDARVKATSISVLAEEVARNGELVSMISTEAGNPAAFVVAAIVHYAQLTALDQALDFAQKLRIGAGLHEDDPVLRLRDAMVKRKAELKGGQAGRIAAYALTAAAAIHHSRKSSIKLLRAASTWAHVEVWP